MCNMEYSNKIYGLDFLKFVAAVLITNSHFIPVYKDVNVGLATFGVHGNALFFFVAGFLIMKGLLKRKERFDNWMKRRLQRLWPAVFLWAVIAAMVWGDGLSWQKILVAPNYWFLQAIVVYYALFYWVGRLIAIRGGVYMAPLRCQCTRFDSQRFFVSTRSWLNVSHSLALCVPFQRDGHGDYGVHVSGED